MLKCNKDFWRGYYTGWIITAICCLLAMFLLFYVDICHAIEVVRQKNVSTYIAFPMIDVDGDIVTGASSLDSEYTYFSDNAAGVNWTDLTNEALEIGPASGWYNLALTQAEMDNDYLAVQVKTTTTDAKTQHILIRTQVGDPLNYATTDDGGTIDVTGGAIDEVTSLTGHTAQTGDSYAIINSGTVDASVTQINGTAITGTGTQVADAFEYFFNVASPAKTINDVGVAGSGLSAEDVWVYGTRTLTAGTKDSEIDNIVTYTGTTIPGMITTNGASITTAIGYIDTEIAAILEDTGTTLPAALVTIQADLDSPNQYKADVSGVATAVNLATVDTVVDAIKAKTDNLPVDPADDSDIDAQLATIQADLDNPTQYKATGFSTHAAADVWAVGTRTLSAFSFDVGITSAAVDAIWDETITGHSTADTFGKVIDDQIDGLRAYGDGSWIKGTTVY